MTKILNKFLYLIFLQILFITPCTAQEYCSKLYRKKVKLKIYGPGYFELDMGNGVLGYTRRGRFRINCEGSLALYGKYSLSPSINLPDNTYRLRIEQDGTVYVKTRRGNTYLAVGIIAGNRFENQEALQSIKPGIFIPTESSGYAISGTFGLDDIGLLIYETSAFIRS
jgi:flagellar basal body rod protein FlgG